MTTSSAQKTPETKARLEQGHAFFHALKFADAIAIYKELLPAMEGEFFLQGNLGIALYALGQRQAAIVHLRRAVEISPTAGILRHYGRALAMLDRQEEALAALSRAVEQAPDDYNAHGFYASTLREFCLFEKALAEYETAYKLNPNYLDALWSMSDIHLGLGNFKRGWENYEVRWKLGTHYPFSRLAEEEKRLSSQRWTGEALGGKTLLIYMEQGFGDTLLSSRFIPLLKSRFGEGRIIFQCHPDLHRLFQTIPGVDLMIGAKLPDEAIDYHVPMMSLPALLGIELETLPPPPPLWTPEKPQENVTALLNLGKDRLKVGIVWSGKPTYGANYKRAVPFTRFLPLAEVPGVQLYSLQKGPLESELADAGARGLVHELGPYLTDFAETGAILKDLDLIIMTDTSVAHLAGSLNVPVWNLLSYRGYWIYMNAWDGHDCAWYPSMRIFRQPVPGDWDSVFKDVRTQLEEATRGK